MSGSGFRDIAGAYWSRGLSVVPIEPGTKRPAKEIKNWPSYINGAPKAETGRDWCQRFGNHGIGLLLGTEIIPSFTIVAVDVDDDAFVCVVRAVLGVSVSEKVGKKGATFFAMAPKQPKLKSTQLRDSKDVGKIDILAAGKMTVLPPTVHPDTHKPYVWRGQELQNCDFSELPIFDQAKLDLLRAIIQSEHVPAILSGSCTHTAGLALSAQLVAKGLADEAIFAIFMALLPANYDGDSLEELPEWLASAREKGFDLVGNLPLDDATALIIEGELKPLVNVPGDEFLRYAAGYWQHVSNSDIDRKAKTLLNSQLGPKRQVQPILDNVRKCLLLNVEKPAFGAPSGRICVRNGTVNVATGELEEHSPDHELRFQLEIDYDPNAACPIYEDQLAQTLKGDTKAMAVFDEFAALTLVPDMKFQKALYLVGVGGSGKSLLLKVVESMHDPNAVTATPIVKIEEERHLTDLVRKLVCFSFDIQTDKKIFGENFIRITGGDPVTTRRLYHEVESRVIPTVRFMGSMNLDMPKFIAAPDALERRLILLPCGELIQNPDLNRFEKINAERAGILARWVRALNRLYRRGHFDIPKEAVSELEDYIHDQDPFDLYVMERLSDDPNAQTPVAEITRDFNLWAGEMGASELQVNVIGRKLRQAGFNGGYTRAGTPHTQRIVRARIGRKLDLSKNIF